MGLSGGGGQKGVSCLEELSLTGAKIISALSPRRYGRNTPFDEGKLRLYWDYSTIPWVIVANAWLHKYLCVRGP